MAIWRGQSRCVYQGRELSYKVPQGWMTYNVWTGDKSSIEALGRSAVAAGYTDCDITSVDNVTFKLRAAKAGIDADEITDQWEILGSEITEDIFTHPKARALSSANLAEIKKYHLDPTLLATGEPTFTGATAADAALLWGLVKNNQLSFQRCYYILRNTRTTGNNQLTTVSYQNVERLHTFAQLPAISSLQFPAVVAALSSIDAAGSPMTVPDGYDWKWLKQSPTHAQTIHGKYQGTQEWWLYAWSTLLYEAAT